MMCGYPVLTEGLTAEDVAATAVIPLSSVVMVDTTTFEVLLIRQKERPKTGQHLWFFPCGLALPHGPREIEQTSLFHAGARALENVLGINPGAFTSQREAFTLFYDHTDTDGRTARYLHVFYFKPINAHYRDKLEHVRAQAKVEFRWMSIHDLAPSSDDPPARILLNYQRYAQVIDHITRFLVGHKWLAKDEVREEESHELVELIRIKRYARYKPLAKLLDILYARRMNGHVIRERAGK